MQMSHRSVQLFAFMLLIIFTAGQCQLNDSRRAVTEHQLMHDRGRNIQSLKRLIWLSSAIEGLHTAQARSAAFNPSKVLNLALNPAMIPAAGGPQPVQVQSILRDFFYPHLAHLSDEEP
ncbi:parathyroid hormone 4 [Leuresthes tenuis]|uniref:parathyroid hormone 4 n=1 Tax=Leuresthes tenuis TaxID=355514 RepID=UPI003B51500C